MTFNCITGLYKVANDIINTTRGKDYLRLCFILAICESLGPFRLAARPFAAAHQHKYRLTAVQAHMRRVILTSDPQHHITECLCHYSIQSADDLDL